MKDTYIEVPLSNIKEKSLSTTSLRELASYFSHTYDLLNSAIFNFKTSGLESPWQISKCVLIHQSWVLGKICSLYPREFWHG